MFVFICWYIWKWRNDFIFNNAADLPFNSHELIINTARDWVKATTNIHPGVDIGVLKLNVDGSHKGSTGSIGAGRVIRDHAGHWIVGYSTNLRHGQILEAELWGLFFGLKLAVEKHLYDVIVEMDSSTTVMLMHNTEMIVVILLVVGG
ncbi:cytochrome P450, family 72, subfamily A, polypeptide 8, partial [Prunus dulcis]